MLDTIDQMRDESEKILIGADSKGESLGFARLAIVINFRKNGIEPPEDVFAFVTGGQIQDWQVQEFVEDLRPYRRMERLWDKSGKRK